MHCKRHGNSIRTSRFIAHRAGIEIETLERRQLLSGVPTTGLLIAGPRSPNHGRIIGLDAGTATSLAKSSRRSPRAMTQDTSDNLYFVEAYGGKHGSGAVFETNATTGVTTLVSENGTTDGTLLSNPTGIVMGYDGMLYVSNSTGGTHGHGSIVKINPGTGAQTLVSENGATDGKLLDSPGKITTDYDGNLILAENHGGEHHSGAIVSVNPTTGDQTLISENNKTNGHDLSNPVAVAAETDGTILALDHTGGKSNGGRVVEVNPTTGAQTVLSSGHHLQNPNDISLDTSGDAYVSERHGVVEIDTTGGTQTKVAGSGKDDPNAVLTTQPAIAGSTTQAGAFGSDGLVPLQGTDLNSPNFATLVFTQFQYSGAASGLTVSFSGATVNNATLTLDMGGESFSHTFTGPVPSGTQLTFTASNGDALVLTTQTTQIGNNGDSGADVASDFQGGVLYQFPGTFTVSIPSSSVSYSGNGKVSFGTTPAVEGAGNAQVTVTTSNGMVFVAQTPGAVAAGSTLNFYGSNHSVLQLKVGSSAIAQADVASAFNAALADGQIAA